MDQRLGLSLLVATAGAAALSWELFWQHFASLALGVSAPGTAITLAVTMASMTAGSLAMAARLRRREPARPLRLYGVLELVVGLSGLALVPGAALLSSLDAAVWQRAPALAPLVQLGGMALLVGPAAMSMGATIPVLGLIARAGVPLGRLYAVNTAGAACGTVAVLILIASAGLESATQLTAMLDLLVGLVAFVWQPAAAPGTQSATAEARPPEPPVESGGAVASARWPLVLVAATGFATFALEVAWFRALRSSLLSTTDTFAILLVAVLVPLSLGARLGPVLQRRGLRVEHALAAAGVLVLLVVPLVERFHLLAALYRPMGALPRLGWWTLLTLGVIGPPMLFLGVPLPSLLEAARTPRRWGFLYATNTLGAVIGSLGAAWLLLPGLGIARTGWLVGTGLVLLALLRLPARARAFSALAGAASLLAALALQTGNGRDRVQARYYLDPLPVVAFREAPDATVAVVVPPDGKRRLFIDGFSATGEDDSGSYMPWMGRLPMLLVPEARRALVICFGTGQTANAVREENPGRLDVVDVSADVLQLAPLFESNRGVLGDPRVHATVMDGRAWLRREPKTYDVVTLEPMPPHFAGVNALYSTEFYQLLARRLAPGGVAAQWLPFHLVTRSSGAAIVAAFVSVFPDAILWIDPSSKTGILLGRQAGAPLPLGADWPGVEKSALARGKLAWLRAQIALGPDGLRDYAALGTPVTDDNQLLAYAWWGPGTAADSVQKGKRNLALVEQLAAGRR